MGWFSVLVVLFSVVPFSVAFLEINEVMYDPIGNDNDHEFVEIVADGFLNLSGYIIADANSNDTLVGVSYIPGPYSLIVEEGFNATSINASIYSIGKTIGNNLNNDQDTISLYYPNWTLIDTIHYDFSLGGSNNGRSLEQNAEGVWMESIIDGGTPGQENSNVHFSDDFSALQISEIYPNTFEDDDAEKPEGEWVELYNPGDALLDVNGLVLKDQDDENELLIADDKVMESTIIYPHSYLVIYRDGDTDFGLNNYGPEEVRLFDGNTLLDNVSYSNTLEGMSLSRFGNAVFTTIPTPGEPNSLDAGCDWFLDAYFSDVIIENNNTFDMQLEVGRSYGFPQNLTVSGVFQDLGGNVVRTYSPWNDEYVVSGGIKDYRPVLAQGTYQFFFSIMDLSCEDDYPNDNNVNGLVVVNAPPSQNTSSLRLEQLYLGNDDKVTWGDQFTAKVVAYKADDNRYSLQLWAEKNGNRIGPTTKANLYDKYTAYPLTLPVQLYPNCNEEWPDGTATLIVEAFGLRQEQKFSVEGIDKDFCQDYTPSKRSSASSGTSIRTQESYQIVDLPAAITPGEALRLKVQLLNEDKAHTYSLYAYLYRGSKCYSCLDSTVERDSNQRQFSLQPGEAKIAELLVKVDSAMKEGQYSLKVKIRKDAQKTEKELTEGIYVQQPVQQHTLESSLAEKSAASEEDSISFPESSRRIQGSGIIVYQSNIEKSRAAIPIILAVTFGLLSVVLVLRQFQNT